MKLLYLSYVDMNETSGPSINEGGFLRVLREFDVDLDVITGDITSVLKMGSSSGALKKVKKIVNYIVYSFAVVSLIFNKSKMADKDLVILRLGPLPIAESMLVLFSNPKFVIKTLGSGNLSWASGNLFFHRIHLRLYAYLAKKSSMIDTVTDESMLQIKETLPDGQNLPIHVIDNGVDTNLFKFREKRCIRQEYELDDYQYIVGYTGNFGSKRGATEAIITTAQFNADGVNVGCVILGYDPDQASLVELSISLGIEGKVHFLGSIPFENVPEVTSMLDIGFSILSNESKGASPQKVRQYVASGVSVISTPGSDDFIEDIQCGFLVKQGDLDAIYSYAKNLLSAEYLPDYEVIQLYVKNHLSLKVGINTRLKIWSKICGN